MNPMPPSREQETGRPPAASQSPVVVVHGLTYGDLRRAVFLAASLFLLWQFVGPLTTLLLFFLLVFILSAVMNPVAVKLQERGIPRIASALGMVVLILGVLTLVGSLAVPPLVDELGTFFKTLGAKQDRLTGYYEGFAARYPELAQQLPAPETIFRSVGANAGRLLGQVGRYTIGVVVGIVSLLLMLVLVIFTVSRPQPLLVGLLALTPERYRPRMESALRRILVQLKNWAFGSLVLGLIIGVMTAAGLWLLGLITREQVPYILLFSVIAGIGEMIPNIGPVLAAVPPVLVALTIDPMLALYVLVLFIIIQQLENNLIVPLVMGQSLNLHPVSVTFTVLVMGALFGLLGAILAVPTCAIVKVCWEEFYLIPKQTDVQALETVAMDIVQEGSPNRRDDALLEKTEDVIDEAAGSADGATKGPAAERRPAPEASE